MQRSDDTLWPPAWSAAVRQRAIDGDVGVQTRVILDNARDLLAAAEFSLPTWSPVCSSAAATSGDERRLPRRSPVSPPARTTVVAGLTSRRCASDHLHRSPRRRPRRG
jgi:hypothetical protein